MGLSCKEIHGGFFCGMHRIMSAGLSEGRLFKGGVAKTQRKSRNLSMSIEAKLKDRQTKQFIDYMS